MFAVQQHSLSLLNMLLEGGVTFCTHNFAQLINPVTFNLCVDELLLSNGVYEHPNPPVESFTPLLVDHIMDNNNVLLKKPDEDELNGEMRYLNNKMYYSPIVKLDNELAINPAGVQSKLYDYIMLYYYPNKKILVIKNVFQNKLQMAYNS